MTAMKKSVLSTCVMFFFIYRSWLDTVCFGNLNGYIKETVCCDGRRVSNSQSWSHTNQEQHPQGDALVQIPVLHSNRDHQSPHKQHVCVLQVLHTHLRWQGHSQSETCVCAIFILAKHILRAGEVALLTSLDSMIPNKGKRMAGSRAVTASGRTSVHQYTAIRTIT